MMPRARVAQVLAALIVPGGLVLASAWALLSLWRRYRT